MPFKCACGFDVPYDGEPSVCERCGLAHRWSSSPSFYSTQTYWFKSMPVPVSPSTPPKKTVGQQYHDLLKQANRIHGSKWKP
jgi:hypothetical protein